MAKTAGNIAIIGAGIMGLSVAHALRESQPSVYDGGGFPADNASWMAGGMLAPWSEIEHLPEEFVAAGAEGIKLWKNILPGELKQNGSVIVAHKDDEYILERLAAKLPSQEKLNAQKIAKLEPSLARFETGLFLKDEAHINPQLALDSLGNAMKKRVWKDADPEELSRDHDWVVDCRGLAAAKEDKELRGVKGEIVFVRNTEFNLSRPVRLMHPRYPLYIVPRPDNVFMIGATVIESEDNTVILKSALELLSAAYSLHPSFGEAEILDIRAGVRPAYPDNLPRIAVDGNIIRCNGLFRHGYLLAPVMAQCVKDFMDGRENNFISLFRRKNDEHHNQRPEKKHNRRA
jgi:glycine oxidase